MIALESSLCGASPVSGWRTVTEKFTCRRWHAGNSKRRYKRYSYDQIDTQAVLFFSLPVYARYYFAFVFLAALRTALSAGAFFAAFFTAVFRAGDSAVETFFAEKLATALLNSSTRFVSA